MPSSSLIRPGYSISRQGRDFAWSAAALVVCFGVILVKVGRFAIESDFNSYILLVPAIAAGLAWAGWKRTEGVSEPNRALAMGLLGAGIVSLGAYWRAGGGDDSWREYQLTLGALSFVFLLAGIAAWFLGRQTFGSVAFPLFFLTCMVPLPEKCSGFVETFLQQASASTADSLFQLTDLPVYRRDALSFQIPGITLQVAPECSGIQSTVALFVVSLAAGYLFLRSPWKRTAIALIVVPLGILRNAVRIVTIGELCGHFGPEMINSYIHRKGGWIFFLILLVPFLGLVLVLARSERGVSFNSNPIPKAPC